MFGISKTVWAIIVSISTVLAVVCGLYQVDDRYAKAVELQEKFKRVEESTVKTFEVFQMKQQTINDSVMLQIYNVEYDALTDRYYNLKNRIKENPTDEDLKEEFEDVKTRREEIKKNREKVLEENCD